MSTSYKVPAGVSPTAVKQCEKLSRKLGWKWALPLLPKVVKVNSEVAAGVERLAAVFAAEGITGNFVVTLAYLQSRWGIVADGVLGAQTWRRMTAMVDPNYCRNTFFLAGVPLRLPSLPYVQVVSDERFDLAPHGDFSNDREDLRAVVLHWGGLDATSCHATLVNEGLSNHGFIAHSLDEDGVLKVYPSLDLARVAWHGAAVNGVSVGFDICRSPLTRFASRYPDAKVIDNPTPRGERRVVDLEPSYGAVVRVFLKAFCDALGIVYGAYPGNAVLPPEQWKGVIGHHHVSPQKWDVAPWSPHLWPR